MRTGTPRKLCIGGWCSGKPYDRGCLRDVRHPHRAGVGDEQTQHTAPVRQLADGGVQLRIDAVGDEVGQLPVRPDDAEGPVAGADQFAGRRDDPLEHGAQVEVTADAHHRVEQGPQALAAGDDLTGHAAMLSAGKPAGVVEDLRP